MRTSAPTPADFRPYEQELWHFPTIQSQGLWRKPSYKFGSIPEPLYRLRLSVLNDLQGRDDCPMKIYIYPSLETLTNATNEIHDAFGGAFPTCGILYSDPTAAAAAAAAQPPAMTGTTHPSTTTTTDEAVMAAVEDPRTRSMVLQYDPQSASESWAEFVGRVRRLGRRWTVEEEE